ncbi:HAMP domain-containing histidine kinase [Sinorhizobium numidicum]|uniref:histidine kinase n=1 Tax=Sinorhizobium numidicum TaxID=680248 RepID=A0ABY8CSZ6_9HYPH|nr:HAMP domain-containing sensor histidine kinase [Sinorhizobium numidicum]WEX74465.1 HAMP domain-containing histidine kinase [Sinorhizobium numidicum]WEX80455.1 HAMP domain-containing histidine kinase [Sinorhizobium numidicum]
MRWWRKSLAAQFICFLLAALIVSQVIGFLISWDERDKALRAASKGEFFSRTASLATLLESIPAGFHTDVLRASGTTYTRFWMSEEDPVDAIAWRRRAIAQMDEPLPNLLPAYRQPELTSAVPHKTPSATNFHLFDKAIASEGWTRLSSDVWTIPRFAKYLPLGDSHGMGLAVQLSDGRWLNSVYRKNMPNALWNTQSLVSLGITAATLALIGVIVATRIARPMRRLAGAAEALGRGQSIAPLPETGPDDIRRTAEAFNRMQARLTRFVEDRTRMLAAISHDLRTPLTSLRLRAEFVSDTDAQQRMLATIDEIQTMTEAALAFAREEAITEATRTVDLTALIESLCDDLAELGQKVTFLDSPKITYRCRPDGLRRAARNLIENAVRYGTEARVKVAETPSSVQIVVEDRGPGIAEKDFERVFAPFFRLESSRNRETGGVGLGLSIARATVRHHGGDITLSRLERGLRATITLPTSDRGA